VRYAVTVLEVSDITDMAYLEDRILWCWAAMLEWASVQLVS